MTKQAQPTILLLDDEEGVRDSLHKLLERAGYKIVSVGTSEEVFRAMPKVKPALAILDIHLAHDLDGYEICRKLRSEFPATEIFLMSGVFQEKSDQLKGYEAGAIAFFNDKLASRLLKDVQFFFSEPKSLSVLQSGSGEYEGVTAVKAPTKIGDVLLIDDDEENGRAVALHLEAEGLIPYVVQAAHRGIMTAHKLNPSAIILDMNLPDLSGTEILAILKANPRTTEIPVLVLTGTKKQGQELTLIENGAVDYLIKGESDLSAIPARIKQRIGQLKHRSNIIIAGPVRIECSTRKVRVYGEPTPVLTAKEFDLLVYIVERKPAIVSWDSIASDIWNTPAELLTHTKALKTISTHLESLRAKLGRAGKCLVIHKGKGVQFDPSGA